MLIQTAKDRREEFQSEHPLGPDDSNAPQLYESLPKIFDFQTIVDKNLVFIVMVHMVHTLPYFLEGLANLGTIGAIIPKESQYVPAVVDTLRRLYHDLIPDPTSISKTILKESQEKTRRFLTNFRAAFPDKKIIIVDHGGYFAPRLDILKEFEIHIAGIVEHTWNGEIKYAQALETLDKKPTFVISSIARTALKALEDRHVAKSIVNSIATNIFSAIGLNQELSRLNIGIMGYGHMGAEIAHRFALTEAGNNPKKIKIYDISPEATSKAKTKNFETFSNKNSFLAACDLIVCATSNASIDDNDLEQLKEGSCVIFVTSSDDLLSPTALNNFELVPRKNFSTQQYKHKITGKSLYINFNSINFSTGSTASPILHLIFSAVLISILESFLPNPEKSIQTLTIRDQEVLKNIYQKVFGELDKHLELTGISPWSCILGAASIPTSVILLHLFMTRKVKTFQIRPLPFHFVGRGDKLKEIAETFYNSQTAIITQSIAGLGGAGKSALAAHYAQRALKGKEYDYIITLDASNEKRLYQEFVYLAHHLKIEAPEKISPKNMVAKVYECLSGYKKLLIIFENPGHYKTLHTARIGKESIDFIPPPAAGQQVHRIITTRNDHFSSINKISLGGFSESESREYIQHYLPMETTEAANNLGTLLRHFPLALSQAVAYLVEHNNTSIADYVRSYNSTAEQQKSYLQNQGLPEDPYRDTVYTTWNISFEALKRTDLLAPRLLNVIAYFDEAPIPMLAIQPMGEKFKTSLNDTIKKLKKYSLIQTEDDFLRVHGLVQAVSRLQQQGATQKTALNEALLQASNYTTTVWSTHKERIPEFISHARKIVDFHNRFNQDQEIRNKILLLLNIGESQHFQLLFSEQALETLEYAEKIYDQSKNPSEKNKADDLILQIYIYLANSSTGAGKPLDFIKYIKKLLNSPKLTLAHVRSLLRANGISLDLNSTKKSILALPLVNDNIWMLDLKEPGLSNKLKTGTPDFFFETFFNPTIKPLWLPHIPMVLENFGAYQLAIVYLMFEKKLKEAEKVAQRYVTQATNIFSRIESSILLTEARVLIGNLSIRDEVARLEKASHLLKENPDTDPYWHDQVHYVLAVLHAAEGNFSRSHEVAASILDHLTSHIPSKTVNQNIKNRVNTLIKLIDFFEAHQKKIIPPKILAQAYRIAGHFLHTLQDNDNPDPRDDQGMNLEPLEIKRCFENSLHYDPQCAVTHYQYGVFLYQDTRTHKEAAEHFTEAKDHGTRMTYRHLEYEGRGLPECMFEHKLIESEKAAPNSLYTLASSFLMLLHCEKTEPIACLAAINSISKNITSMPVTNHTDTHPLAHCIDTAIKTAHLEGHFIPTLPSELPTEQALSCYSPSTWSPLIMLSAVFINWSNKAYQYLASQPEQEKKPPLTNKEAETIQQRLKDCLRKLQIIRKTVERRRSQEFEYATSAIENFLKDLAEINKKLCKKENILFQTEELEKDINYLQEEVNEDIKLSNTPGLNNARCPNIHFWPTHALQSSLQKPQETHLKTTYFPKAIQ